MRRGNAIKIWKKLGSGGEGTRAAVNNFRRRDQAGPGRRATGLDAGAGHVLGRPLRVVTTPFGHKWAFGTHLKDLTPDEMRAAMKDAFAKCP